MSPFRTPATSALGALGSALSASALAAAELAPLAADADYGAGLDAYEQALAADSLGRRDDARRLLREARARLDAAIGSYRAVLSADPTREDANRRQLTALAVGRPCCGRRSLWNDYGIVVAP